MSKRPLVYQKKNPPDFSVILCLLYTVQNVSVNNWETQRLFFFQLMKVWGMPVTKNKTTREPLDGFCYITARGTSRVSVVGSC